MANDAMTKENLLAAAARAEAAGDAAAAESLRSYASSLPDQKPEMTPENLAIAADRAEAAGDTESARLLREQASSAAPPKPTTNPYLEGARIYEEQGMTAEAEFLRQAGNRALETGQTDFPSAIPITPSEWRQFAEQNGGKPMEMDWGSLPIGADPARDAQVGEDELGRPMYRAANGATYTVNGSLSVPTEARPVSEMGAGDLGSGIGGMIKGIGQSLFRGLTAPRRALTSEGVTNSDVLDAAGAMTLTAAAPRGLTPSGAAAGVVDDAARASGAADDAAKAATETLSAAEIDRIIRSAAAGNQAARAKLAELADVDPTAAAAAERLGMDLPVDVLANNSRVQEVAGATRAQIGSEASAMWTGTVKSAMDAADEAMSRFNAGDVSMTSEGVRSALTTARDAMKTQADRAWGEVDAAMPRNTPIAPENVVKVINEEIANLGGRMDLLPPPIRDLLKLATGESGNVTLHALKSEKSAIGEAIGGRQTTYSNANDALLRRIYSAISEDELMNARTLGGAELAGKVQSAISATDELYRLRRNVDALFGKDEMGSIATGLRTAVTRTARGDTGPLTRMLENVPPEMRGETVLSGINAASRSMRATEPGFGFAEFAKTYGGIKGNEASARLVQNAIGPEATQVLDDLWDISRRITTARQMVPTTGRANQILEGATAENFVERFLGSEAGRRATGAASAGLGAAVAGPVGAAGAAGGASWLAGMRPDRVAATGRLFADEGFKRLTLEIAQGQPAPSTIARVANSTPFIEWAEVSNIADPKIWLQRSLFPAANSNEPQSYQSLYGRY